jgi:fibronectin type 3 domain-containing protein
MAALTLMLVPGIAAHAIPSVWTEHNDNNRTGQNLSETTLTPSNVNVSQFGALFHYTLDDQSYSQPLYVPGLTMAVDGKSHNVVFVTTVNNSVYAFDADSNTANGGSPLWHVNLTPTGARPADRSDYSAMGACNGNYLDFAGHMGIVGTPVIDTTANTLFVVARTVENGSIVQRLHALDCTSGAERTGSPVVISASYAGTNFDPSLNNQRPALALANGVVYIGFSSQCDFGGYHGYVIGYNASNLSRVAAWAATTSGTQGGIWQGGQAPAIDTSNNLYLMTGNGTWDGSSNFGESFVKLAGGSLTLQDYFTPNNYANLNGFDNDLGASGCLLIPGTNYVFGGGKQGVVYLLNTASLGHENATDQVVQEFQATFPSSGNTGHIHGGPAYYNSGSGQYVYLWGENDYLRAYQFNGSLFNSNAVAVSTMTAPMTNTGMPGGFLSISANGNTNGILWALTPYDGNANNSTVAGILHAFDAQHFSNGALTELWNSRQNASRDDFGNYAKFTYPTVVNGRVYLSTFGTATSGSGALWVYGLTGNNQTSGPVQINCGGAAASPFVADTDFNTGNEFSSTAAIDTSGVTNPAPQAVYQSVRWAPSMTYTIPGLTASASYQVRLHFCELSWTAAGQRLFNVAINGTSVLSNFDIFAAAGGQNKANIQQFNATANSNGQIVIAFSQGSADNPEIAGIEVLAQTGTAPAAPTGLSASAGNSQVTLSWTGSSGATSYNVYRGAAAGGESTTPIATGLTGTSYTNAGLTNGTAYYYKVAAVNASGTSDLSNEASATPAGSTEAPYGGTPWAIPGTVQFENYDTGGEGVAYHDADVANQGGQYRTTEGVDVETCSDTGGGYDVGWTNAGEWMKYTVNVASAGTYTVTFRVADGTTANGSFHLQNASGTNLTGVVTVTPTGGWQTWATVTANVTLPAGQQILEIYEDTTNFNLNYMTFAAQGTVPPAPTGLAATAGNAQVSLSWTGSSGATSYNVYRGTSAGGEGTTAIATGITGSTYTDSGLTNGTKYYYTVKAVNSAGTSAPSNETSTTPAGSTGEGPYGGTPAAIPGTVQAENYDTGGQGIAYNVTSTNGTGNSYRSDGVDLETTADTGGGYDLGWTNGGQWFRYTVNVATAGTYAVTYRVANGSTSNGSFHIQNASGTNLSGAVTVAPTGGWQTWTSVTGTITLPAGQQVLTVYQDTGNFNINWIGFASQSSGEGPYGGTPWAIPGTIQSENYDTGGEGVAYHDTDGANNGGQYRTSEGVDVESCSDTGGGYDIGWNYGGEWQKYTVNVASAGTYTVTFRVADGTTANGAFHLQNASGTNLTGTVTVTPTGGWQTWTNVTAAVTLPAGQQIVTVWDDGGNYNINYMTFAAH